MAQESNLINLMGLFIFPLIMGVYRGQYRANLTNLMGLSIFLLLIMGVAAPAAAKEFLQFKHHNTDKAEHCDIFNGQWIYDPYSEPPYTAETCDFVYYAQDCTTSGRPDGTYLHWRWQPYGCDLPSFDPEKFLRAMENKSIGGIGDSLIRNQLDSLLCLLSKVAKPVVAFSSDLIHKWHFPLYNFTVEWILSNLLLKSEISMNSGNKSYIVNLHLDVLDDTWTSRYHDFDYVLIGDGAWFDDELLMFENGGVVGCSRCQWEGVPDLGMYYPFRKAINLTFNFIIASDHKYKPKVVVFRSITPSHFEHGHWNEGGFCNRTLPFRGNGDIPEDQLVCYKDDRSMQGIVKEEFAKAVAKGNKNGVQLRLLDIYYLSLLRSDGHPNHYTPINKTDCLHWCLPGITDTWNDLLMTMLLGNEGIKDKAL